MKTTDLTRFAASGLAKSRTRTTLTATAIVVAAFTLTLTSGVGAGISSYIDDTMSNIGSTNTMQLTKPLAGDDGGPAEYTGAAQVRGDFGATNQTLTQEDIDAAASLAGVVTVTSDLPISVDFLQVVGDETKYTSGLSGVSGDQPPILKTGVAPADDAAEIVIPNNYVETLGFATADEAVSTEVLIGFKDSTGADLTQEATITGVIEQSLAPTANPLGSTSLLESIYDEQVAGLDADQLPQPSSATLTFDENLTQAEIETLQSALVAEGLDGATTADRLGMFATVVDVITGILLGFAVIALIAASFGIVNTLLMSVQERTRDIGLFKAHGMSSGKVFGLFTIEAVGIGLIGAFVGSGLGVGLGLIANQILTTGMLADLPGLNAFAVDLPSLALIIAIIAVVAFAAGTIPAARAARKNPIAALRYE